MLIIVCALLLFLFFVCLQLGQLQAYRTLQDSICFLLNPLFFCFYRRVLRQNFGYKLINLSFFFSSVFGQSANSFAFPNQIFGFGVYQINLQSAFCVSGNKGISAPKRISSPAPTPAKPPTHIHLSGVDAFFFFGNNTHQQIRIFAFGHSFIG